MKETLTSGDVLFARTIKSIHFNRIKKLKRVYSIVFGISTEHIYYSDLAWYLNDFVFKFHYSSSIPR